MNEINEEQLVKFAKKGDVEAFEKLISQYEKKIYALCLHLLKDPEEAYDAAQEVCIKVWRQLEGFEGQAKFSTWLYRIGTNQCLDIIRKNKKRSKDISLFQKDEGSEEEWMIEGPHEEEGVAETVEKKALQEVVKLGISELKEDYQVIITLRDIEEHSYEEIADVLELSLGTVKSRLARARQALKKILGQNKEPYRSFFRHIK